MDPAPYGVSPVTWRALFDRGEFVSPDEARGALKLAVFQSLAARAHTIAAWTGLTPEEVGYWLLDPAWLPDGPANSSRAQPLSRTAQRQ
jgi:hypothetical protein